MYFFLKAEPPHTHTFGLQLEGKHSVLFDFGAADAVEKYRAHCK